MSLFQYLSITQEIKNMLEIDKKTIIDLCKEYSGKQFLSPKNNLIYSLWPFDQIETLNDNYNVEEFLPDFIGFGSDGGDELLAINTKDEKIYSIPFIPMTKKEAVNIAKDTDEFIGFKR